MSQHVATAHVSDIATGLPVFPELVPKLLDCLDEEALSLEGLVRIARRDPVISGAILAAANRLRRMRLQPDLSDLLTAASIIGMSKIRQIILSTGLNRFFDEAGGHAWLFEHSQAVAILAQELASLVHLSPDEAYVAGILHDVGQLALYVEDGRAYTEVRRKSFDSRSLLQNEVAAFGMDHCQVGVLLGNYWSLPPGVVTAIATHHQGEAAEQGGLPAIIYLAEVLVRALDLPYSAYGHVTALNPAVISSIGLTWQSPELLDCIRRGRARFVHAHLS